ncbi:MAG: DNA mismatch repair endonuclease MutL [Proteobacteria bacterium]|nr:DNA mismatch repair endonuclease MutL [Pseudomonadota bacterium]
MSIIHVLPQALSNQLAAGEVLERAASAIKELIENSLDAGADSIEIEVEDGGKKRLSVCDNGCGMTQEDAKLCVLRHATSKIHTTDDLAAIATMGFRGEALASMAAVSRMTITTQRPEDEMGTFLRIEGSEIIDCRETAAPSGTQIVIEDLFFNTPARLKFLKTTATEVRRIYEVIEQFALSCPEVRWKLTIDGRVKCDWPSHNSLQDRALAVFGRSLYDNLYPIDYTVLGDVTVDGLFCSPDYSQSSSGRIFTYINHRVVKDKTIQSAINQAYREFLHGKLPCVVLFLTIPLDQVDVNVHPTKHEVRFQTPDNVFKAVYRALRQSLEKTPWIQSQSLNFPPTKQYLDMMPTESFRSPEDNMHRVLGLASQHPSAPINARRAEPESMPPASESRTSAPELDVFELPPKTENPNIQRESISNYFEQAPTDRPPLRLTPAQLRSEICNEPEPSLPLEPSESHGYFSSLRYIGQHALTYLICADGDSIVIIDQHAAHERINFERLKRVADDVLPAASQGLLFPLLLQLDTRLSDILTEYMDFFEKLGFQIDELGNHAHALRAVPECLVNYDYTALIRDALIDLGDSGRANQFEDIRDNILATMACHSSIRSGQKLSPEEVRELFRQMDATGFRSNCPHGRPVHFVLSISELEKRFLRTGYSGLH